MKNADNASAEVKVSILFIKHFFRFQTEILAKISIRLKLVEIIPTSVWWFDINSTLSQVQTNSPHIFN